MDKIRIFRVLIFVMITASISHASAVELIDILSLKERVHFNDSNEFLVRMGFEDFQENISKALENPELISDVSRAALEKSQDMLASFNAARDLGNFVYAILNELTPSDSLYNYKTSILQRVILQQLSFFPLLTLEPLNSNDIRVIEKLPLQEGLDLKRKLWKKRARQRFFQEKINLIKAFIVFSDRASSRQLIRWLDDRLTNVLADPYIFEKRQQNRLLGRALVLSLVRFYRLNKLPTEESKFKKFLFQHGVYIENYIDGLYVQTVNRNDVRATSLKSGDVAFEYSHGQEAFFTSLVIQPPESKASDLANKYSLTNSIFDALKFLNDSRYYEILDKRDTYKKLTDSEIQHYRNFWDRKYANGFSHSGVVHVNVDQKTGIKIAWIWDIYPEGDKIGVVRVLAPEAFSYSEKMLKIAFLRYDPEKLLSSYKAQIGGRGYLENVWTGYSSFVGKYKNGKMGPAVDKDEKYIWKAKISKADVFRLGKFSQDQAENWFATEIWPRVFSRIRSYLFSAEAKVFADGLVSAKDMLYCSQLIAMAYLEGVNLDLQTSQDKIWETIRYFDSSIQSVLNLNIQFRLVSPNGLIWQSDIFKNLVTFQLDRSRVDEQRYLANPTVAEQYNQQLDFYIKYRKLKINEGDLLELKEELIDLDLES